MSAGSSPTGGIGGLFYALLLVTGIILNRDKDMLKNNARIILPVILVLSFCIVLVLNVIVVGKYMNFTIR
jgi:hypothetical protein